jgi:hypothetical protein
LYFEIRTKDNDAFSSDREWRLETAKLWKCKCGRPRPDFKQPIDVTITNPKRNIDIDILIGFNGFRVVKNDFINLLGVDLLKSLFFIGNVFDKNANKIDRLKTLFSKTKQVYVRGSKYSPRRCCSECKRLIYQPTRLFYLCGIDSSQPILQSIFGNLILRHDLFVQKLQGRIPPKLEIRELNVEESPLDDLPIYLNA